MCGRTGEELKQVFIDIDIDITLKIARNPAMRLLHSGKGSEHRFMWRIPTLGFRCQGTRHRR